MQASLPGSFPAGLSQDQITEISRSSGRRRYRRGAVICVEGDSPGWLLVIIAGHVKISSYIDDGSEVLLDVRGPGALVGEVEATDGRPRPATVTALEAVEALMIFGDAFTEFARSRPGIELLLATLCERLRDSDRKRIEFAALDATERVVARLVQLADRYGEPVEDGVIISLALTQEELAGWTGASREAVSKAFRSLRRRGWIETGRRTVTIRNLAALRQLAR